MDIVKKEEKNCESEFLKENRWRLHPYKMISQVNEIENYLWNYYCSTATFNAFSVRDHYQYMATFSSALRGESLYCGDLFDLCDFKFHQRLEPSSYQ